MNKNLPIKKEEGWFGKIKLFFRNIFSKSKNKSSNEEKTILSKKDEDINIENNKDIFNDSIKIEVDESIKKQMEKDKLFDKLVENPELLDSLSNQQLELFIKYGEEVIEKNNKIIEEQNMEIEKLKKSS